MPWLKQRKFFSFFWPLFSLVVLILFFSFFWPRSLTFLTRPLAWLGVEINSLPFFSTTNCFEQQTITALAVDQAELQNLITENEELKKQLSFFDRESFSHVTARIVNRSASPVDETFIIDRGSEDGVKEDTAVIVSDGYIIGRVIKVYNQISVVQSLLGRSAKVTAAVLNATSHTIGIAEGTGGALLSLNFVPQDQNLKVNDLIVTSGLEENIPSGLIIGIITSVARDPAAPFQTATVEPLADTQQAQLVSVIIPPSGL